MSDRQPLVSIIIPIYNVEAYLEECLESVCKQSYSNLEIILVDDGSPDNCGEICDRYARNDSRIRVIHKKNGGLSDARNSGMKIAQGEFLYFLDSDDYIRQDTILAMVEKAISSNADIVCGNHRSFLDGTLPKREESTKAEIMLDRLTAIQQFTLKDWGAWGKLYRHKIHEGIEFPFGKIHEDEAIMFRLLNRCNRILCVDDRFYFYRVRKGSITAESYSVKKMDWMIAWSDNLNYISTHYPEAFYQCLSKAWMVATYNIGNLMGKKDGVQHLQFIRKFAKKNVNHIIRNPYISISSKLRVIVFLLSNIRKEKCLYKLIYGTLGKMRGRTNV